VDQAHIHLDEFARLKTFFHDFDPRVKLVSCLIFVVIVVSLNTFAGLGLALFLISLFILGARLPVGRIFKRLGFIIPLVLMFAVFLPLIRPGTPLFQLKLSFTTLTFTWEGLQASAIFLLRFLCGALLLILVTFTTPFHVLLRSLRDLRIPQIFTQLIQFTLRYFFVLYDEVIRMQRARRSRNFRPARSLWSHHTITTLGGLLGVLFIRSFERGERVYHAMLARGFQGEVRTLDSLEARPKDFLLGAVILLIGILTLIIDQGGWLWLYLSK